MITKLSRITLIAVSICIGSSNLVNAALIDGVISSGEYGDGITYNFELGIISGGTWISMASDAELHMVWNNPNQLAVAYKVPFSINDNFFGDKKLPDAGNSSLLDPTAPWPGAGRNYTALESSDMAQFIFQDEGGGLLFTFQMDYFRDPALPYDKDLKNDTTKNTVLSFADGTSYNPDDAEFGNTVTGMATSLMWNFSTGGFAFDSSNSPAPGTPGYVKEMIYEFSIDTSTFDNNIGILLAESHHSPSKLGDESLVPPPTLFDPPSTPSPVPEPATVLLFGTGLVGLACFIRKKKKN